MRIKPNLRDQPTEYLEELFEAIGTELAFRRSIEPRKLPRCTVCGHTGHNVMTCGGRGLPHKGESCDCGRSDCPQPEAGEEKI